MPHTWRRVLLLLAATVVGCVLLLGGSEILGSAQDLPQLGAVDVELAQDNTEVWSATTAGLFRFDAKPGAPHEYVLSPSDSPDEVRVGEPGSYGLSILDTEPLTTSRKLDATEAQRLATGSKTDIETLFVETLFVLAEDKDDKVVKLWAGRIGPPGPDEIGYDPDRIDWDPDDIEWHEVTCEGCAPMVRLTSTYEPPDCPSEAEDKPSNRLVLITEDGVRLLDEFSGELDVNVIEWTQLGAGLGADPDGEFLAASQDNRGRFWALVFSERGGQLSLRVYDSVYDSNECKRDDSTEGRPEHTDRLLPDGWSATESRQVGLTSDTRGGMWVGSPHGVVWMGPDLALRDVLDACELISACEDKSKPMHVMSVDNDRDDIWIGTSESIIRLTVDAESGLATSEPQRGPQVVSMARNVDGGNIWIASANLLIREEIDRWSNEGDIEDPITALSAATGTDGEDYVWMGTLEGLERLKWNSGTGTLTDLDLADSIDAGLVFDISQTLPDGSAFVASSSGVFSVDAAGTRTDIDLGIPGDHRFSAIEWAHDRVWVGTSEGVWSFPHEADVPDPDPHPDISDLRPSSPVDVTAIWEGRDGVWVGTAGSGVWFLEAPLGTDSEQVVLESQVNDRNDGNDCWGGTPPSDTEVVRSGASTSNDHGNKDSFVVVTSTGIFQASWQMSPTCPAEHMYNFEFLAGDTNVALGASSFQTLGQGTPADAGLGRFIWSGSDHGVDLIAWDEAITPDIHEPQRSAFDGAALLGGRHVTALATVGSPDELTLIFGSDDGIFYHRPGANPPGRATIASLTALDAGANVLASVDCGHDEAECSAWTVDHTATEVIVELQVEDLDEHFGFLVEIEDEDRIVTESRFAIPVERGSTKDMTITVLDEHFNRPPESANTPLTLKVKDRTWWEWFSETSAWLITTLVAVGLLSGLGGTWLAAWTRRRAHHDLIDIELGVYRDGENLSVVTQVAGSSAKATPAPIIRQHLDIGETTWDALRASKSIDLLPKLGDELFAGLMGSQETREALSGADFTRREVRLRLHGLDDALDRLPWEALRTHQGLLLGRTKASVVRDLSVRGGTTGDRTEGQLTSPGLDEITFPVNVLIVVASPADLPEIAGAEAEIKAIQDAAATNYRFRPRGTVTVLQKSDGAPVTPERFQETVRTGEFDFIHVIAHGEQTERGPRLWFEDDDGDPVRVEDDELVDLFANSERGARSARLVVLNTCASAGTELSRAGEAASSLAKALVLRANVPAVVGMSMKIREPAAIAFGVEFYRTLFRHGQVDHAMLMARRAIDESDADWLAPRLYVGAPIPELFGKTE